MNEFTCDNCKQTFMKAWSDEDAKKEYDASPWNLPEDDIGIICDDCFQEFKTWFSLLSEEEHKRIKAGK